MRRAGYIVSLTMALACMEGRPASAQSAGPTAATAVPSPTATAQPQPLKAQSTPDVQPPTALVARASVNAQRVELGWQRPSVEPESYLVERSDDGVRFSRVAISPGSADRHIDTYSLTPGSTYTYRIRAWAAGRASNPSMTVRATTGGFRMFDAMDFASKPNLAGYGLERIYVTDREYLAGTYPNYDHTAPNEAATRALATKVAASGQILVIDEETWLIDTTYGEHPPTPAVALANLQKLNQLADWLRSTQPSLRFGFFSILPTHRPAAGDPLGQQINEQLDALESKVNCYFPCYYASAYFNENAIAWQARVSQSLNEVKRAARGKPVFPFVWMDMDDGITPISEGFWRVQLQVLRRSADGVVLWGGWRFGPDKALLGRKGWDPSAVWWRGTRDLVQAPATLALATPAGLAARCSPGVVHLAWNPAGVGSVSVERSKDGADFTLVGIVAGTSSSYDDALVDGSLYRYRLRATNGVSDSAPGSTVTIQSTRDGFKPIYAVTANSFASDSIKVKRRYLSNPANDWVKFSSVDFGDGASGFIARVSNPSTRASQAVELRLDAVDGPLIGTYVPAYTGGTDIFEEQITPVSSVRGVHDLYLVTKGWGISYLDWVRFQKSE